MYDEKDDIGVYATDEEAYKVFDDLFTPIIRDLHQDYDVKANYKHEFELVSVPHLQKLSKLKEKVSFVKVSARRNFKDYPFTPMMSTQSKFQIEKKIVETLGEIYGQYHQLAKIDDETKTWLNSMGIDISKQRSHDAAGINEDWPNGRGVFIDEQKAFVILVNFEDHIQVFTISQDGDFQKCLTNLHKVLTKFEKMGYARHTSLGFLTASPKNLGTTMRITCRLRLSQKRTADDIESFEGTYYCKIDSKNEASNEYEITYNRTLAKNLNENEAIKEFSNCLLRLTENEDQDQQESEPQEEEKALDEVVKEEPPKTETAKPESKNAEETKSEAKSEKSDAAVEAQPEEVETKQEETQPVETAKPEEETKEAEPETQEEVKETKPEETKTEQEPPAETKPDEAKAETPAAENAEAPKEGEDAKETKPEDEPKEDKKE